MSEQLQLLEQYESIDQQQHALAIQAGVRKINAMMEELGPKVTIQGQRMVITESVDPDEAIHILYRLRHELNSGGTALKFIRLWMGDFCSAYADQMEIPMSKAAVELSEVFGEKPKRILRLVNTAERSPEAFRTADVDYTVLQDLADLPEDKDPEVRERMEMAKRVVIEGLAYHEKDKKWMKSQLDNLKKAVDAEVIESTKEATLEDLLVQHYNLGKFFAECADADTCQEIEDSMKALEPSIENLANARGHKLYFEMEEPPLCDTPKEVDIDELI